MTELEKKEIVLNAFRDELEKNAGWATALYEGLSWLGKAGKALGGSGKLLKYTEDGLEAAKAAKTVEEAGGAAKTLDTVLEHNKNFLSPRFAREGGNINAVGSATQEHGFVQSHVADAADYVHRLGAGLNEQTTLGGTAKQFAKNFWNEEKQQYLQGAYKSNMTKDIKPENLIKNDAGDVTHIKDKFGFKRKVRGQIFDDPNKKNVIGYTTKKLAPIRALNYTMTPTGMVATGVGTSMIAGGSPTEGAKEGFKDALLWTPATKGLGFAKATFYDLPKMLF